MPFLLRDIVIAFLLVGMMAFSGFSFMSGLNDYYNVDIDSEYSQLYDDIKNNTLTTSSDISTQIEEKVEGGEDLTDITTLGFIGNVAIEIIKLPFKLIKNIPNMLTPIAILLHIPTWALTGILGIISIVVSFIILGAIFKRTI